MRFLGVDCGRKRIGLALSDPTATLARPWQTVPAGETPAASAGRIAALAATAVDPLDDSSAIGAIVVGLPRRLDGSDHDQTKDARELATALAGRTGLEVHLQDERLTSREAESRLAVRERDWRRRKAQIDAVAAAIILQDFLDARAGASRPAEPTSSC
jgi:putative Holliday junction resolvase